ncbi:hypothetical protein H2200_001217 [Cladophialophora chaetospira]|uniref:RING-type domain-containing protein n=1 Tax=Cladophialophora chaetospira TaxID=386627 RepID=A0AA39CMU8_9EURO|nr:hypothetical protein H2200_001217 [Cladophialophora chaetospira]
MASESNTTDHVAVYMKGLIQRVREFTPLYDSLPADRRDAAIEVFAGSQFAGWTASEIENMGPADEYDVENLASFLEGEANYRLFSRVTMPHHTDDADRQEVDESSDGDSDIEHDGDDRGDDGDVDINGPLSEEHMQGRPPAHQNHDEELDRQPNDEIDSEYEDYMGDTGPIDPNGQLSEAQFQRLFFGDPDGNFPDLITDSPGHCNFPAGIPDWLELEIIPEAPSPQTAFLTSQEEMHLPIEADNYISDLRSLRTALRKVNGKVIDLINDLGDGRPVQYREVMDPLKDSAHALRTLHIQTKYIVKPEITSKDPDIIRQRLRLPKAEEILIRARDCIVRAEVFLVTTEALLASPWDEEEGDRRERQCSIFERSRYRCLLKAVIGGLLTSRWSALSALSIPPSPEPDYEWMECEFGLTAEVIEQYQQSVTMAAAQQPERETSSECPICYKEFSAEQQTGEQTVFVPCCKNAIGIDCLLQWMFERLNDRENPEMTCVMCREKLSVDFLGEVLEMKARGLNVL